MKCSRCAQEMKAAEIHRAEAEAKDEIYAYYYVQCFRCDEEERIMVETMYPPDQPVIGRFFHWLFGTSPKRMTTRGPDPYSGDVIEFSFLGLYIYMSTVISGSVRINGHQFNFPEYRDYCNRRFPDSWRCNYTGVEFLIGGIFSWIFTQMMNYKNWSEVQEGDFDEYPSLSYYE